MVEPDWLYEIALEYGYLGLFVVSILGNLIPFTPIPYLAALFLFTANVPGADPMLAGIASGIGGGVGKLLVYAIGRSASRLLEREQLERLEAFKKLVKDYGALAAFLFAATPSPDDVIVIPLGIAGYDVYKFFAAITAGKIGVSLATSYFGFYVGYFMTGAGLLVTLAASIALLAILMWLLLLIDWCRVLEIVGEEGWREILRILREGRWRELIVQKRGENAYI